MSQNIWEQYQIEKSAEIITVDTFDIGKIKYIGGLSTSSTKHDEYKACVYLTIYDFISQKIVYENYKLCTLTVPYISGFLGFREVPEYLELLNTLKIQDKYLYPDVLMVNGFGILHHNCFGLASHLGYEIDLPTIGICNTMLCIDGLDGNVVKTDFKTLCKTAGQYIELVGKSGKIYGVAIKSSNSAENPLYISIGHKISLQSAIDITLKTCMFKIPEPIRNSDIKSKLQMESTAI